MEGDWDPSKWAYTARLDGEKPIYYQGFRLKPGWNKGVVLCDLAKAAGTADLANLKRVYLYTHGTKTERAEPLVFFLDNVRLIRAKTGTAQ